MRKNRVLWGIWLFLVAILFVITENYAIQIVAVLSVLIPVSGIVFARISGSGLNVELRSQISQLKGEPLEYILAVENEKRIGCAYGKATLEIKNLLTGEITDENVTFSIGGKERKQFLCTTLQRYCGKIEIKLKEVIAEDLIGVYRRCSTAEGITYALAMPDTFSLNLEIGTGAQSDLNSDEYSMYKSGSDPGETFAIREYRPGDKIRNIHWKLSEKLDEVTVKELGLPVNNSILILLDSIEPFEEQRTKPVVMDALGETTISVAQVFSDQQIPFTLSWYGSEDGEMKQQEILNSEDLTATMPDVLSAGPVQDTENILQHYEEDFGYPEYAHILIIGHNGEVEYDNPNIMRIICSDTQRGLSSEGNSLYFTPDTMAEDLMYIEV